MADSAYTSDLNNPIVPTRSCKPDFGERVVLSLTLDDVEQLKDLLTNYLMRETTTVKLEVNERELLALEDWAARFTRMHRHLVDTVNVHYTNLG